MTQESTGLGTVEQLLRMRQKETAAANSCLRVLRLTKQAQMHQRTAARWSAGHLWGGGDEPASRGKNDVAAGELGSSRGGAGEEIGSPPPRGCHNPRLEPETGKKGAECATSSSSEVTLVVIGALHARRGVKKKGATVGQA